MTKSHPGSPFERHPVLTLILTVLSVVVLLDFGAAALLKALGRFSPSYYSARQSEQNYRKADPVLHHALIPKVDFDWAVWGNDRYHIHTNSLGFKDRSTREVSLMPAGQRLLFIGDSFTEGVGIEYEQTAVGRLDRHFASRRTEVLNAGVVSYSPIIYLRKTRQLLEDVGLRFDRLVVFIDPSDIENEALAYAFDPDGNVVSGRGLSGAGNTRDPSDARGWNLREFITAHTVLLGRVRNLSAWLRSSWRSDSARWRESLNQRLAMWTVDDELYQEYGVEGLRIAADHMTELKSLLDSYGIALTIAVYPWPDQIWRRDLESRQVRAWRDWAGRHDSQFIDLFPTFVDESDPEQTIRRYFIAGDVHWNAAGHARVADAFLREYEQSFARR
jgi:lysophospholipase L1-like esterase